jgi:predicted dinucleotide-binding enzyme
VNIGLLGLGNIGSTLARRLPAGGHDVKVANSRGPHTVGQEVLSTGARAVTSEEAVRDVDVLILSIPLSSLPGIAGLLASAPPDLVLLDTSNYYPSRDGRIEDIENGKPESQWVAEQLGRPVVKAWNAVGSSTFADGALPAGHPDRVALPIAGDDDDAKRVAATLVDDSGFDSVDAGSISDSWRQQPGSPVYCTDLRSAEVRTALGTARRDRLPHLREFAAAILLERLANAPDTMDADYAARLNRMIFM